MPGSDGVQRTGWLYTRGQESVSMRVDELGARPALEVCGPGAATATYDFDDVAELMEFASAEEQRLRTLGFQLHASAERRAGGDRRQRERTGGPDRRQSRGDIGTSS
jgi:hypothetical protein